MTYDAACLSKTVHRSDSIKQPAWRVNVGGRMHLTDSQVPLERELSTTSSPPDIDLAVPWATCHGPYESQK